MLLGLGAIIGSLRATGSNGVLTSGCWILASSSGVAILSLVSVEVASFSVVREVISMPVWPRPLKPKVHMARVSAV